MPAKSNGPAAASKSAAKASPKPATKSTVKPAAKPEIPAPAAVAPVVKTVKMTKAPGANSAQVTRRSAIDVRIPVPASDRDRLVAEAAYYRAEARGFSAGDEQADWFAAALEVDAKYRFED